jgi:Niemann-Pick C1 protein
VFSTVFSLLGVLWLLNFIPDYKIELNAISVVNMVLACGLSIEFTVHIVIFFFRCKSQDPIEKLEYAMKNVGVSVFVGIVTTKILGILF